MKGLHLAPELTLPADAVTSTLIVYGGKGMGKTNLGTVFCEELAAAGQRFSVIDPMGVFWGIRHSADGKGEGAKVLILGGIHGDIPIEPTGGAVVADLVADEEVDTIIDISRRPDGRMWGVGERIRFVADYCTRLYERQGERRRPIMQVIDEAGRFCPQEIRKDQPEIARCMGALERMVEEARNVGIGVMLITQRSARMNKSVSELADCMIAFRTVGPRSIDAILDWFGEHVEKSRWKALIEQLRTLARGSALVVSPGWLNFEGIAQIRMRRTFDSSATPTAGGERKAKGAGAKIDLARYSSRMSETIERVKGDDPKALRKQVAELQRELAKKAIAPAPAKPDPVAAKDALDRAAARGAAEMANQLGSQFRKIITSTRRGMLRAVKVLRKAATELEAAIPPETIDFKATIHLPQEPAAVAPARSTAREATPAFPQRSKSSTAVNGNAGEIDGPSQRVLDSLAELEGVGIRQAPRMQVALFAGYGHPRSKGFTNALGALRTAGHIDYPSAGTIELSESGRAIARVSDAPVTSAELHSRLTGMLGGPEGKIIRELVDAYPSPIPREELSVATGYGHPRSKGFTNAIGRLRTLGYLDYPSQGQVIALPTLFLEGDGR